MANKKTSRTPKSKEEIRKEMEKTARIEHMKVTARKVWPLIDSLKSIYDGQTVVNATAGFLKEALDNKMKLISVSDLDVSLKKEKASELKTAIEGILRVLAEEPADDAAALLERMGNSLGQFAAAKYLTNPMSVIKMDEFIA